MEYLPGSGYPKEWDADVSFNDSIAKANILTCISN